MLKQVSPPDYASSEVLAWREINKPEKCGSPPNHPCPTDCLATTCPSANCSDCDLCSGLDTECQSKQCWCRIWPYSPENEMVIVVPNEAINRSSSEPGQIKVVPAQ